ncbi:MAG: Holliday junction branch migration protein RuvA [Endomicrobiales bacterium]|jgi:Holliday junction DNA helicase RuvA
MITFFRGILDSSTTDRAVIDVSGIGYQVNVPGSTAEKLPVPGKEVKLFIVESVAMYGGSTSYYGFLTAQERDMFQLIKDEVPGTGAKKALDYLDKITKSLPDFTRAVANKDCAGLTGIFGFSKKTADKIIVSLKDKIGQIALSGPMKWAPKVVTGSREEAVAGLVALGYKEALARQAVERVVLSMPGEMVPSDIIRRALQDL